MRREQRVGHGDVLARERVAGSEAHFLEQDLAREGVSVRVKARRREPEGDVSLRDPRPVQDLRPVDDADDRARDVVLTRRVKTRHLRRLAAEERRGVFPAAARDPVDHRSEHGRLDPPGGDVVEEEQRPRALHEDVVDAVVHEIGAARAVASGLERDLQLRPHAVGRGHEDGIPVRGEVGPEETAEASDVPEHAGSERGSNGLLGSLEGGGLGVDVDAGVGVARFGQDAGL